MVAFLGGGGIESDSSSVFSLNNVTITGNSAGKGGGIDISSGSVVLANTILAGNAGATGAPDCAGPLTTHGYNLFGTTTGCTVTLGTGDIANPTPKLGPLASNGGPTQTHALLPGSPAIDAGNPAPPGSGDDACAATDQRGIARPQPLGGRCDIGAYELVIAMTSSSTTTSTSTTTNTSSTATTTLPPTGCAGVPTFTDIDCRLNLLIDKVSAADNLGRLKKRLVSQLQRAARQKETAEARHNAGKQRAARSFLKHAIQTLRAFDHTIKSLAGRHTIPAGTRAALLTMSGPIETDMQRLLTSL
jgi:hypothetical protein